MSKITRITQKIFGSTAASGEIGKFGSLAAGSPVTTTDPAVMQSLSNWLDGWFSAILGGNSPAIEDMNAVCYVFARQLAYLFQSGIPEWDAGTIYYIGSMVNVSGVVYISLTDNNLNNATTDTSNWVVEDGAFRTVTGTDTATTADKFIRADATAGDFTETLPPVANCLGKTMIVKAVNTNTNQVTVKGNAAELIDQANTFILQAGDSLTVFCNGTSWDKI